MTYLTLGTVWKDEYEVAKDFIKFHKSIGIEKFVILDREYYQLKELLKDEENVEIIHFPYTPINTHRHGFGELIRYLKGKTKWLITCDADECLVPVQTDNIREILKNYEQYASIQINWRTFGSSNNLTKIEGSLYERFLLCADDNEKINFHTQFICQPDRCSGKDADTPHFCDLLNNEVSVNTDKNIIPKNCSFNIKLLYNVLYYAHYYVKSKEEYITKYLKGYPDGYTLDPQKDFIGEKDVVLNRFHKLDSTLNIKEDRRVLELWNIAKLL